MSKFFKALEQAERDQARRSAAPAEVLRPAEVQTPLAEPAQPRQAPALRQPAEPADGINEHLVSLLTPAAFEAEQYRALRHTVEHLHNTEHIQVIAMSSPAMGDGKTLTALNLAGALAQAPNARVLLIDADLRRPAVHQFLGLEDTSGADLVDAILDPELTLDAVVRQRPQFNLSVICAGLAPPSPYEMLKSARLGELLDEARQRYDYIILDTPPLVSVQDCRVIGRWVDGFLLVVAADQTPRRLLEEALTAVDRTKILGIIFNRSDRSIPSYYPSYYGGPPITGRSSLNGHLRGALRRAVSKVGDSLRRDRS
jgi:capsular exopolysaccharide synthesis family protein